MQFSFDHVAALTGRCDVMERRCRISPSKQKLAGPSFAALPVRPLSSGPARIFLKNEDESSMGRCRLFSRYRRRKICRTGARTAS